MEDEPEHERDYGERSDDIGLVGVFHDRGEDVFAESETEPGQKRAPDGRSREGETSEYRVRHAEDASRNRDQVADYRNETPEKGIEPVVLVEKRFGFLVLFTIDEEVLAVFFDERFADVLAEQVVRRSAREASESTHENYEDRVEFSGRGKVTGRDHDELRGNGKEARFERHEKEYSGV